MDTKRPPEEKETPQAEAVDTLEDGAGLAASNSLAQTLGILNLFTPAAPLVD